jgi:energy-converting hydrogenase Eha subunit C
LVDIVMLYLHSNPINKVPTLTLTNYDISLIFTTHRRRQSRATALSPQRIREEIAPNAEFESGGTLFRLFDMYETCNASGETIIACAYYDVHVAESLGHDLQVHLFCNLCELCVRFIPSNMNIL